LSNNSTKKRLAAAALTAFLLTGTVSLSSASVFAAAEKETATGVNPAQGVNKLDGQAVQVSAATPYRIVALGDSITAGYEYQMDDKTVPYGYADRVYEQALYHGAAELRNYGILGLKSAGLQRWLAAAEQQQSIKPEEAQEGITKYPRATETIAKSAELRDSIAQANLIVMTIGGNDFLSLFDEMKERAFTTEELTSALTKRVEDYIVSLQGALQTIGTINPSAKIVLTDQYLPVPKPTQLIKAVSEEQYEALNKGVKQLSDNIAALVTQLGSQGLQVKMVNISEPFNGKELSYTAIIQGDSHPRQAGYEVIGKAFANGIWGDYRYPSTLDNDVPLRVIVNGKGVNGPNKPVVKNGTTFLPMRDIANVLGAGLSWDNKTQTATIKLNETEVAFTIGAKTMIVNGKQVPLDTPAYLEKTGTTSSTYLPLAALSRGLGHQVVYRQTIKTAFINS